MAFRSVYTLNFGYDSFPNVMVIVPTLSQQEWMQLPDGPAVTRRLQHTIGAGLCSRLDGICVFNSMILSVYHGFIRTWPHCKYKNVHQIFFVQFFCFFFFISLIFFSPIVLKSDPLGVTSLWLHHASTIATTMQGSREQGADPPHPPSCCSCVHAWVPRVNDPLWLAGLGETHGHGEATETTEQCCCDQIL